MRSIYSVMYIWFGKRRLEELGLFFGFWILLFSIYDDTHRYTEKETGKGEPGRNRTG